MALFCVDETGLVTITTVKWKDACNLVSVTIHWKYFQIPLPNLCNPVSTLRDCVITWYFIIIITFLWFFNAFSFPFVEWVTFMCSVFLFSFSLLLLFYIRNIRGGTCHRYLHNKWAMFNLFSIYSKKKQLTFATHLILAAGGQVVYFL